MLYQRYENRIKKIAKIKVAIYKYRIPILIGISLILILTGWLLIKKGTIKEDLSLSSAAVVYGDEYSVSAKTFMTEPDYQYKTEDGEWTDGLPKLVGEYKIRLKSRRIFGFYTYGQEQDFSISKKRLSVNYGNNIKYGEEPIKSFGVKNGDAVKSYALTEKILYVGTTSVGLEANSVRIENAENTDVTFCYDIDYDYRRDVTVLKKPVTITTASDSKVYDGTPLEKHELVDNDTAFCYTDVLSLTYNNSITAVGSKQNTVTIKFTDGDGFDRTENYAVTVRTGTLTVTPRPITVKPKYAEKIYDNTPLLPSDYELTAGTFADGETADDVYYYGSQTNVGESNTSITGCIIKDGSDNFTTSNYRITYQQGSIKITPRPIKVTDTGSTIYNDNVFVKNSAHTFVGEYQPVYGHTLVLSTVSGDAKVYSGNDINYTINYSDSLTNNYTVDVSECSFEIMKRTLEITTDSANRKYNAEPLSQHSYTITAGGTVSGQQINGEYQGTITDFGTADNIATFNVIRLSDGKNTTENYDISVKFGKLTVEKCPVIFTLSGTKVYDGTNTVGLTDLTLGILRYDGGHSLFKGHITNFSGNDLSFSDVGSYTLDWHFDRITDEEKDVTDNYEVTWENDYFTIEKRPLTIRTESAKREYNREPLYCEEYTIISGTVVGGQTVAVVSHSEITEIGSIQNFLTLNIKSGLDDKTYNYQIYCEYGTLTVTPIAIVIGLYQKEVTYDGNDQEFHRGFYFKQGKALEGDEITLKAITDVYKDAGTYDFVGDDSVCNVTYRDAYKGYYNITVQGQLVIEKARVTIKSKTAEKPYDGQSLSANEYEIISSTIAGGWAAGESSAIIVMGGGSQTGKGWSYNYIASVKINDEDEHNINTFKVIEIGQDVIETKNYIITVQFGTLTVT